jgi:FAD/FMN-containing dehydrogenase
MMALALAGALTSVHASETVNDVTQLNPVVVEAVRTPTTVNEVSRLVAGHPGPVSIGGARHSQGGQSACAGCLFIDMRRLNRVLALDHRPSRRHLANRSRDA